MGFKNYSSKKKDELKYDIIEKSGHNIVDDEEVELYFMNAKAPCFIKDERESYIYLILPVNFNQSRA